MSADNNKVIARREVEEIESGGNLALVDELFSPGFRLLFPGLPPLDRNGFKQVIASFRTAFPDLNVSIDEQIADGSRVVNRLTIRGTHQGPFQGVPPTGRQVEVSAMNLVGIEDGKIVELRGMPDLLGLMQQLGALPATG